MAVLQKLHGADSTATFDIADGKTSIGRHEDCDIMIDSPAISRFHAQILCDDGRCFVEDLNSRNGTFVNGLAVYRKTLLTDTDRVEFANLPFRFHSQDSLSEISGSWGIKANVVTIDPGVGHDDSIRRRPIQPGDRISDDLLGSDSIRESQLVASCSVAESGAGWPVLRQAPQKINYTLRLMHSLRRNTRAEGIIARSLQAFFEAFPAAERIALVMKNSHESSLSIDAAVSRDEAESVEICLPVVRRCIHNLEALLYVDHWMSKDGAIPELDKPSLRTILAVPMVSLVGECLGVIQLDTRNPRVDLKEADLELLVVMSNVVAYAIEQSRETDRAIAEAVVKRGTAEADSLRRNLTACSPPVVSGYRLDSFLLSSPEIAADYVDFVSLPEGRVACLLIDVPGRGPSAAGLMALIARLLSEAVIHTGSASTALQIAQSELIGRLGTVPMVISAGVMILNPERSAVQVSVAGHCPLYGLLRGELSHLSSTVGSGGSLGSAQEAFRETEIQLGDDDVLLLFSDGITKLPSGDDKPIGSEKVIDVLRECVSGPRMQLESRLKSRLQDFTTRSPPQDDVVFSFIHRHSNADTACVIPAVLNAKPNP